MDTFDSETSKDSTIISNRMKKIHQNLAYLIIIVILVIIFAFLLYQNFFSNKEVPDSIKITGIQNSYSTSRDIILSGSSKSNSDIILLINGQMGMLKSDENGKWIANLGKLPEGDYSLETIADDSPTSRSVATAQLSVSASKNDIPSIDNIANSMAAGISSQIGLKSATPKKLIMIPASAPEVLTGSWKLIK
jgi:hypothetical protein